MDESKEEASQRKSQPTPIDEELLSMSTESDTWTLVKGNRRALETADSSDEASANRVEELQSKEQDNIKADNDEEEEEEKKLEPKPDADSTTDDFSDGISVISESDCGGRISPHPFLREHLADLDSKFSTGDALFKSLSQSRTEQPHDVSTGIRRRHSLRSPSPEAEQEIVPAQRSIINTASIPPLIRRGFTGIFYVGLILAILAFVGKLRSPPWSVPASSKGVESFEQKLNDMELQNNLMRAEIDILSKQVNFLSTLNEKNRDVGKTDSFQAKQPPSRRANEKTFKAWQGNGDSMEQIQITKADLKRPYKCLDSSFVEVGGTCVEMPAAAQKSLIDEMGEAVNKVLQQSETYRTVEKVAEKLNSFTKEDTKNVEEPKLVPPNDATNSKGGNSKEAKYQERTRNYEKSNQQPNERHNKKYANSKERFGGYEPKGKGKQKFKPSVHNGDTDSDEDSQERYDKKYNSKERFSKHGSHRHDSHKDGEWQDRLMRHREDARRQHDIQRNDKNWFIKRGDGRERVRRESGENVRYR